MQSLSCRARTPMSGRKSRFSLPAGAAAAAGTQAPEPVSGPHAPTNTPSTAPGVANSASQKQPAQDV